MRHELEHLHENKLDLQGHLEPETARLSTSTLLDGAQQKCVAAQKTLDRRRKKHSQLEAILVEAKEIMLRIEQAAQPLVSLKPLLPEARSATDDTLDGNAGCVDGERHGQDRTPLDLTLTAPEGRRTSLRASWESSPVQIMGQLESTAQLLCVCAPVSCCSLPLAFPALASVWTDLHSTSCLTMSGCCSSVLLLYGTIASYVSIGWSDSTSWFREVVHCSGLCCGRTTFE